MSVWVHVLLFTCWSIGSVSMSTCLAFHLLVDRKCQYEYMSCFWLVCRKQVSVYGTDVRRTPNHTHKIREKCQGHRGYKFVRKGWYKYEISATISEQSRDAFTSGNGFIRQPPEAFNHYCKFTSFSAWQGFVLINFCCKEYKERVEWQEYIYKLKECT